MDLRSVLAGLIILLTLAQAQEKKSLTIDEALQLGLRNNRGLHISAARSAGAEAKSAEMGASRLPTLALQAGYTRLSDIPPFAVTVPFLPAPVTISPTVLNTYSTKLTLTQPLFTGLRIERAAEAASAAADAAESDYRNDRIDLVYSIRTAYWNLYRAREVKGVIDENVGQIEAHLTDVRNMMGQGLATTNDVLKVQVQLSSMRLSQIDAANNVATAAMALNLLLGLPVETATDVTSTIVPDTTVIGAFDQLARQPIDRRPDVKAAESRRGAAEASVGAARGAWYPQISLIGDYNYARPNPRILPAKDEFQDTWDVGVVASFTLWNWGSTGDQTEQAKASYNQANEACEQIKESARMDVRQSYLSLLQARDKIGVAQQGVEQAQDNYRITKNKFETGTATNTDLLDAEVALLQAKLNNTIAVVDFELAVARMNKALGREE